MIYPQNLYTAHGHRTSIIQPHYTTLLPTLYCHQFFHTTYISHPVLAVKDVATSSSTPRPNLYFERCKCQLQECWWLLRITFQATLRRLKAADGQHDVDTEWINLVYEIDKATTLLLFFYCCILSLLCLEVFRHKRPVIRPEYWARKQRAGPNSRPWRCASAST